MSSGTSARRDQRATLDRTRSKKPARNAISCATLSERNLSTFSGGRKYDPTSVSCVLLLTSLDAPVFDPWSSRALTKSQRFPAIREIIMTRVAFVAAAPTPGMDPKPSVARSLQIVTGQTPAVANGQTDARGIRSTTPRDPEGSRVRDGEKA